MIIIEEERLFFRDSNPDQYKFSDKPYIDEEGNPHDLIYRFQESNRYKQQFLEQPQLIRNEIKKIRNSLKNGYFYSDNPNIEGEDTHSLGTDTSKYDNKSEIDSVVWSKKINTMDRFNYRIYKPRWDNEKKEYVSKVVLDNCKGHGEYKNKRTPKRRTFTARLKTAKIILKRKYKVNK